VLAVLDRDHNYTYNYTGCGPGDLVSGAVEMDVLGDATRGARPSRRGRRVSVPI